MNYKEYHNDWRDIIRPEILKRDQYKCRICGIRHKATVYKNTSGAYVELDEFTKEWARAHQKKVFTLYLQVAHIDHNKDNNEPSNLMSLCPIHHAKFDADHKRFLRKTYRAKTNVSTNQIPVKYTAENTLQLEEIRKAVYELTKVRIHLHEASSLIQLINKFK